MIKRLLTASLLSVAILGSAQQLTNAGFENWTSGNPNNWGSIDEMLNSTGLLLAPTTLESQVSPGKSGLSACELKTQTASLFIGNFDLPGVVNSGTITFDATTGSPIFGRVPYSSTPSDYSFYYKYAPVNGDTAGTQVIFTKWNTSTNKTDTIGYGGDTIISGVSSFTLRSVPITWLVPGTAPDSVSLIFISSISSVPQINTSLIIDDVNMIIPIGISENNILNDISVFPNPASDVVNFSSKNEKAVSVEIFDFAGRIVADKKFQNGKVSLLTSELSAGVYMYRIIDADGAELMSNKFTVSK